MKYLYLIVALMFAEINPSFAVTVNIAEKAKFDVPVARQLEELAKGLMFVKELPQDGGMLFDFRSYLDRELSMWMKNTYIPLDMLFISCDMKVVDVYKNAKPLSLDYITSKEPFCYVLEINGGQAAAQNIVIGDKVILADTK